VCAMHIRCANNERVCDDMYKGYRISTRGFVLLYLSKHISIYIFRISTIMFHVFITRGYKASIELRVYENINRVKRLKMKSDMSEPRKFKEYAEIIFILKYLFSFIFVELLIRQ